MASTHCATATKSLNADCAYVRDAMLESAVISYSDTAMDVETIALSSDDQPVAFDESFNKNATLMDLKACDATTPSDSDAEVILNGKHISNGKDTSCNMKTDVRDNISLSITAEANGSLDVPKSPNQVVAGSMLYSDPAGHDYDVSPSPKAVQLPSDSECENSELRIAEEMDTSNVTINLSDTSLSDNQCVNLPDINQEYSSTSNPLKNSSSDLCEDVQSLLNTPISKDYVNCVWSNEPLQSVSVNERIQRSQSGNLQSQPISTADEKSLVDKATLRTAEILKEALSAKLASFKSEEKLAALETTTNMLASKNSSSATSDSNTKSSSNCPQSNSNCPKEFSSDAPELNSGVCGSESSSNGASKPDTSKSGSKVSLNTAPELRRHLCRPSNGAPKRNTKSSGSKRSLRVTPKPKFNVVSKNPQSAERGKNALNRRRGDCSSSDQLKMSKPSTHTSQPKKRKLSSNNVVKRQHVMSVVRTIQSVKPTHESAIKNNAKTSEKSQHKDSEKPPETNNITTELSNLHLPEEHTNQLNNMDPFIQNLLDEGKLHQRLQASFKRIVTIRSTPVYIPPENSRFFTGKVYECKPCGDKFVLQSSLLMHISRKSAIISYKCPQCNSVVSFNNRCSLLEHLYGHGQSTDTLNAADLLISPPHNVELKSSLEVINLFAHCYECGKPVISLKKHMQGNDISDPITIPGYLVNKDLLTCSTCGQLLPSNCSLISHMRFHQQNPPFTCPECGELFSSHANLFDHTKTCCFLVCKRGMYQCPCKCKFNSNIGLKHHIMASHLSKLFKCRKCKTACATVELMKMHQLREHYLDFGTSGPDSDCYILYYLCQLCPGKIINCNLSEKHSDCHTRDGYISQDVIECGRCKSLIDNVDLISKHRSVCFAEVSVASDPSGCSIGEGTDGVSGDLSSASSYTGEVTYSDKSSQESLSRPKKCRIKISSSTNHESTSTTSQGLSCANEANSEKDFISAPLNNVVSDVCSSKEREGKNIICRLCKHSIASSGDKIAIKKHFISHHQALFLQALHNGRRNLSGNDNKFIFKFPIQKVSLRGQKSKRGCAQGAAKKKKNPATAPSRKTTIPAKKEIPTTKPKKNTKVGPKKSKINIKKLEASPFKIGTVVSPNSVGKNRTCYKCSYSTEDRHSFLSHIGTHKTNPSDLQCPVCGMCFIVRPPLEKHLLVQHNIKNMCDFLRRNGFDDEVDEDTEMDVEKVIEVEHQTEEELQENQCKVCRVQFDSAFLLEKHFRVHGGAFLLANLKAKKF